MAHSHSSHDQPAAPTSGVEADYVNMRAVVGFGVGLAVVTAIVQALMLWMWHVEVAGVDRANPPRVFPMAVSQDERRPPEPRLQGGVQTDNAGRLLAPAEEVDHNAGPKDALRELRAEEDVVLNGYSWVDRNNNIVRIPVAEAMKLTLERGLPSRGDSAAAATPAAPPAPERK